MTSLQQQALALAGVAQVARIVDQVSKTGTYPPAFLESSVHSLFKFEAADVAHVYGGITGVKLGLNNLSDLLANRNPAEDRDVVRYVFGILYLERQFATRQDMVSVVHTRLQHTQFKADHFASHLSEVCHSVSGIYQDTLSKLKFRIKVSGSAQHLQDEANADVIRAALLAGIRSAYLWRQLGGHRWKLLLQRRRLLEASRQLSRDGSLV